MSDIQSINGGFTGNILLVDQDGDARDVWCQAGVVQGPHGANYMIVPLPVPGCHWRQVPYDEREAS